MGEQTIYLVSSGEYSDYTVHYAVITKALAEAGVAKVNTIKPHAGAYVETLRLLDYVPEEVTVWTYTLRLDERTGWHMNIDPLKESRWDHEAPSMGVSVEIESGEDYGRSTVQLIRVIHSDQGAARSTAEAMVKELRRTGTKEVPANED